MFHIADNPQTVRNGHINILFQLSVITVPAYKRFYINNFNKLKLTTQLQSF